MIGIGFTLVFTVFSVLHAGCVLGWRRAVAFFTLCDVVTWSFEAVGIATGLVFMMVYASWIVASLLIW